MNGDHWTGRRAFLSGVFSALCLMKNGFAAESGREATHLDQDSRIRPTVSVSPTSDDTAFLNAEFSSSAESGATIRLERRNYRLSPQGVKQFMNPEGRIISKAFCVEIPSGAKIDWNGATFIVQVGIDAVVLSNKQTGRIGDIIDTTGRLVVDGGGSLDTGRTVPLVWFYGLTTGSKLKGITVQNCSFIGGQIAACEETKIDDLVARDICGQGWILGGNRQDQLTRCRFGKLAAWRVRGYGTFNQPGNGFVFGIRDSTIDGVRQRNCGGGIKFAPNCQNVRANLCMDDARVLPGEPDNRTRNSGTKIQGENGNFTRRISISRVVSKNCKGAGLYIRNAEGVRIEQYTGIANGNSGRDGDIDAGSFNELSILDIDSRNAGQNSIYIARQSTPGFRNDYAFRSVKIWCCGSANAATSKKALAAFSGSGRIDILDAQDPRQNMTQPVVGGIRDVSSDQKIDIARLITDAVKFPVSCQYGTIVVETAVLGNRQDPLDGEVTLLARAKHTMIFNQNVRRNVRERMVFYPEITIEPCNAAAHVLVKSGNVQHRIENPGDGKPGGIRLHHPSSNGGEIFRYRIGRWTRSSLVD